MTKRKKILAVASGGGHWTQLKLLSDAFTDCNLHYVTTNINASAIKDYEDISIVLDADISTKFKLLPLAVKMLFIIIKQRPDVVISTGAAPGFFAVIFGKILGAKTIWIDSMANYSQLSLSGKHASRYCDLCLTQWPLLADGKKVQHFGSII